MWNSGSQKLSNAGLCDKGSGIYATGKWINWRTQVGVLEAKISIAKRVLTNLVDSTDGLKIGLMVFNNNQGAVIKTGTVLSRTYTATIKDMSGIFSGTTNTTNKYALMSTIAEVEADSWTPLAESLFESMRYFQGLQSAFTNTTYTSPITSGCEPNFVILVTDGMSTQDRR